jgi:hypothetical protein
MRAAIAAQRSAGKLDRADARKLAKATLDRELEHGPLADRPVRIDEARACVGPASEALQSLSRGSDDIAAAATLALIEDRAADEDSGDRLRRYRSSPNALWRAVAARSAVGEFYGPERRGFYTDADETVRLAALRAALDTTDPADRQPLLQAARLDPNLLGRALAARALGEIADADVVLALRDVYARADEGLRQSIVDAWGQREAAGVGGIRELLLVAERERGAPSIEAGWVLLRFTTNEEAAATGTRALYAAWRAVFHATACSRSETRRSTTLACSRRCAKPRATRTAR